MDERWHFGKRRFALLLIYCVCFFFVFFGLFVLLKVIAGVHLGQGWCYANGCLTLGNVSGPIAGNDTLGAFVRTEIQWLKNSDPFFSTAFRV
jgi:hypothetical protein